MPLARLTKNGSLDKSFSGDGRHQTGFGNGDGRDVGHALAMQGDGKILVVGRSDQGKWLIA
jgi:beta-propeller uncharacterized protein DUF5122